MSDIKKEDESESSEIFNEEEKIKNDIISSSSDEENNQNQNNINTYNNKDTNTNNSNNNNYENANGKLLGNKRHSSKERKGPNDYGDSRKKIKKYNNNNNNNNGYNYSYDDKNNFQPSLDIPLLTFDLYCEIYKEKFGEKNNDDLKKMYEEYKLNHEQKNNEQFFNHHKNDEWFLEKYNPYKYTEFNQKERSEMCQKKAKIFFDEYNIDNLMNKKEIIDIKQNEDNNNNNNNNLTLKLNYRFDLKEEHEYDKNIKLLYTKVNTATNKIEEIERDLNNIPLNKDVIQKELSNDGKPYYFYNPDYLTLYSLTSLTKNVDIMSVIDLFKKYQGFVSLSVTDPERISGYKRIFWVAYDNEENYLNALNALKEYELKEDFTIKLIKSETTQNAHYKKIKLTPPLFDERLNEDIIGSNKIICLLDTYREITNNPLTEKINIQEGLNEKSEEEKINILNLNILYLRKIHGFCYYCLKGCRDERNLTKRCDFLHLRHYAKIGRRSEVQALLEKLKNNENDININISEEELNNAIEFDKLFTNKLNELLNDQDKINCYILLRPKFLLNDESVFDKIEEAKKEFIKNNSDQLEEDKFECKICKKKFIAFNFIENHMKNKHPDTMSDYANNSVNELLTRENFNEDKEKFSKSNIINNREDYEEYLDKLNGSKNNNHNYNNNGSSYDHVFHKKYKDWDDPANFLSNKSSTYMKISYDDL